MKAFKIYLLQLLVSLLVISGVNAQSKKNADLSKTIRDIGGLFKKKKQDSTSTAATNKPINGATSLDAGQAGTIAPGATSLQADQLSDFNGGVAIVRKGTSSALINSKGEFVVPFNTVNFSFGLPQVQGYHVFSNGVLRYQTMDGQQWNFMNTSGKMVASGVLNDLTENKQLIQVSQRGIWTYTLASGKQYNFKEQLNDINEGIGIIRHQSTGGGNVTWSYRKLSGEAVGNAAFDEAYGFSEGMAIVGQKDAYGQVQYGFINTTGKLVIPFTFSNKPTPFSHGFAKVVPKDKSRMEYAFIDKTGQVVFSQTLQDVNTYGSFDHFTNTGYAFNFKYVLDSAFHLIPKKTFFASFGIDADAWFVDEQLSVDGQDDPQLMFSIRSMVHPVTKLPLTGFINLRSRKVVMPVFDLINLQRIYFDPVAKLAYARVCLGRDDHGGLVYREGYINEAGQFVIVKAKGSEW